MKVAVFSAKNYDREMALIAEMKSADNDRQIIGVGRLIKEHGCDDAEFAILISDSWQGKGLGTELLSLLVEVGRKEGVRRIVGHIIPENIAMVHVSKKAGFNVSFQKSEDEYTAIMDL
jgi:acetyltransferase